MNKNQLKELESQLSCPTGKMGKEVGKMMNDSNFDMTITSINALKIKDNNTILEIGHGNCGHLNEVLKQAKNIHFFGLEISKTMLSEAQQINNAVLTRNGVEFKLYDGEILPFKNNFFDRVLTVNTLYFWKQPIKMLDEIYRVLKGNGVFTLTFVQKNFMESLPFVKEKFKLFDTSNLKKLISKSNFTLKNIIDKEKMVKSKDGKFVNRHYSIVLLKK